MTESGDYIKPEKGRYIKLSQALEVLDSCACWWAHDRMECIPAADVRPRWIPVSERLPEEYVNVLCHLRSLDRKSEYYSIDHLMEDGQWWKAANSWKYEVTHWMPLPEPPEEGE